MAVCVAIAHLGEGTAVLDGRLVLVVHVLHACDCRVNLSEEGMQELDDP